MTANAPDARLRWRPLREGAGEGPAAPWREETYAHDVSGPEVRVGGVWDALSELAREGGPWFAVVTVTLRYKGDDMSWTAGMTPDSVGDDMIWTAGMTADSVEPLQSPNYLSEPTGPESWNTVITMATDHFFVVRDGYAVELNRKCALEWEHASSPGILFCGLRTASDRLVTRAAIACVQGDVESVLRSVDASLWETVYYLMRIVWDWTFTEELYSDRIDEAQRALWGMVDDRPKSARDDGNGPTQAEIDAVYYAAFACDIVDRSNEGHPFDFDDYGTKAERCEKIRAAVRDDHLIALADRAHKENV